jgi:carboxyl-terminal processing protease
MLTVASWTSLQADELGKTTRVERQLSKILARFMQDQHLSARAVDDSISERAFDMYIKNLDRMKVYFLKSDIDEFSKWRKDLDNQMNNGEFTAAFAIFKRYMQRVDERVAKAVKLIDQEYDFSIDEELVTDRDLLAVAKDEAAADELWRKRIKYNLLVLKVDQDLAEATAAKDAKAAA